MKVARKTLQSYIPIVKPKDRCFLRSVGRPLVGLPFLSSLQQICVLVAHVKIVRKRRDRLKNVGFYCRMAPRCSVDTVPLEGWKVCVALLLSGRVANEVDAEWENVLGKEY